jgi:glycosyltransferase involved in cell wall biosynthesis
MNVVGWFDSPSGIGQSARSLARSAEAAGLPVARIEASTLESGERLCAPYALNVFHVNADGAASIVELCGPAIHRGRANVGYWYWETEVFPAAWSDRFAYFDEIWAASEFCRAAIAARAYIPVAVVPPSVIVDDPTDARETPSPSGAPFRFLTICDVESVVERKNPIGAVRAFSLAFPENKGVALTVKLANASSAPGLIESLTSSAGSAQVDIDTSAPARGDVERLLAWCDAYVSLHRAEGFGLPIAEAMALGKPVVATAAGGNPELVRNEDSGLLVPPRDPPATAAALARVLSHPDLAERLGRAARKRVAEGFSTEVRLDRIEALYRELVATSGRSRRETKRVATIRDR